MIADAAHRALRLACEAATPSRPAVEGWNDIAYEPTKDYAPARDFQALLRAEALERGHGPEMRACFCRGPQNGEPRCPCAMRAESWGGLG